MKYYERASDDVFARIKRMVKLYHPDITKAGVTVDALFVWNEENDPAKPALSCNGYSALAVVCATSAAARALGEKDVLITIDRERYNRLPDARKDALLDHELQHVAPKMEGTKNPVPKVDGSGRPLIGMRSHDRQFGWFDVVAKRHGSNSGEVVQARSLIEETGQLYFEMAQADVGGRLVKFSSKDLEAAIVEKESAAAR
jgi:hypothetical protein